MPSVQPSSTDLDVAPPNRNRRPSWVRRAPVRLVSALAVLALVAVARIHWVQGVFVPVRVTESSMAPHLIGQSVVVVCPVCVRNFVTQPFEPNATDLRIVCSRCGTLHTQSQPVGWKPGDRVFIHKWMRHRPENLRWDVVAIAHPQNQRDWLVKRLIGLPGERVQLQSGDIYVNGRVLAKSLAVFRELAIPVLDTRDVEPSEAAAAWSRWCPSAMPATWTLGTDGFHVDSLTEDVWSWLSFRGCDVAGRRPDFMLLLDDYAHNHSLSRRLHPVRDFLVRCDIFQFRKGRMRCRAVIDGHCVEVTWDPAARVVRLDFNGHRVCRRQLSHMQAAPRTEMEFGVCDRRVHFALDQKLVMTWPFPDHWEIAGHGIEQLQLGAHRARLTVRRIELLRDIYYIPNPRPNVLPTTPLTRSPSTNDVTLGPDHFYVLGDNSPVSEDSRHWGPIHRDQLLGVVTAVSAKDP